MNDDITKQRLEHMYAQNFSPYQGKPPSNVGQLPGAPPDIRPHRIAHATEYAAFHLGQINRKLDRLIELLEADRKT